MRLTKLFFFIPSSIFLFSCGGDPAEKDNNKEHVDSVKVQSVVAKGEANIFEPIQDEEVVVVEKNGITLTEIKSEGYNDAELNLNTKQFNEGKNHLSFAVAGVQNYSISYLANNYTLTQFSTDVFEVELMFGNNVFLAFLTDKNGLSIKSNQGSILKNAVLGGVESLFDMDQPHLFYHLPQAETTEPILDFYLVNTSISAAGNKVKVSINDTEFILDKWAAYRISGLTTKNNRVRIQLLDKHGSLIDGPFNDSGDRIVHLKKANS
jgi:hypothetical protein